MNVIESLQDYVADNLSLLSPIDQAWQPTELLPDLTAEDWSEQVQRLRESSLVLPDELLVVLVGNMVTEEALPNYTVSLEHIVKDPTGTSETPWAQWLRRWTAEENRHGDLLNAYLRLSGRVDMAAIERTIHHLISNGFSPGNEGDPHSGLIYAAFQERATRISHGNIARLSQGRGEENLARICRKIAADETRHEVFYTRVVGELFERDPENTLFAYRNMLRKLISMPGSQMTDGRDPNLFDQFAAAAQRIGVYTSRDYASIIRHLNTAWNLERRSFSGKAARAQDYLCRQPERYEMLADEIGGRIAEQPPTRYSWLGGRVV
ncbi:acyl-ACP desaturase [Planctomyces sp. SH-PL62]|uniref:acyl-ACP desaturase n=1 Tax=Planctomyces sp. SH-PL62 TaxID=1636152 RepID=UPI00078CF39D|nr:acyl-ACP desaturase [Planctomyces sp. SH-PL62]AMV38474.1 Putative acyl-[acyl-carrier-protein] desaturase desA1 [Planctomyces sp. SH-PL62]